MDCKGTMLAVSHSRVFDIIKMFVMLDKFCYDLLLFYACITFKKADSANTESIPYAMTRMGMLTRELSLKFST